jgi:hypothetical protein
VFEPSDDPELAALAAQKERKKRTFMVLGGVGALILILVVGIAAKVSADAEQEQARQEANRKRDAEERRMREKQAEKTRDQLGLASLIASAARSGNSPELSSFFVAEQMDGYDLDETSPSVVSVENGRMLFNGRSLPAEVLKVSFVSSNRAEGKRRNLCIHAAAGYDDEFKMWRQIVAKKCDGDGVQERIDGWKAETSFTPQ